MQFLILLQTKYIEDLNLMILTNKTVVTISIGCNLNVKIIWNWIILFILFFWNKNFKFGPTQRLTAMYQHRCLNVQHLTFCFMSSLVCHLCYVQCRTQFFHVDIFPVFMSHIFFLFEVICKVISSLKGHLLVVSY